MEPKDFTNTRKIIVDYLNALPRLNKMRDGVRTSNDVDEWIAACDSWQSKVNNAFWEDTQDINSRDNCRLCDFDFVYKAAFANRTLKARYYGPDNRLLNETAIALNVTQGTVSVQFDNKALPEAFGVHTFDTTAFKYYLPSEAESTP